MKERVSVTVRCATHFSTEIRTSVSYTHLDVYKRQYVACAPKSNSAVKAIDKAMKLVANMETAPVPVHLQDAHYRGASQLGRGTGYKYAQDVYKRQVAGRLKTVDPDSSIIREAKDLGICFGD